MLGFASGLPLALTGQALQAWLSVEGIDIATIGFLSLVGLPYTFKFLWAPLMDRFELLSGSGAGAAGWWRRSWRWRCTLLLLSATSPKQSLQAFALLAVAVAFVSASQDVVIDAYRTDLLPRARARPGLVAQRAGLPAGDDRLGRRRADLDRPDARRRLELERGLPHDGRG